MASLTSFIEKHPRLPALFANTVASKVIQIIKSKTLDPLLDRASVAGSIDSLPRVLQIIAEWVFHAASGAARTMPEPKGVMGVIFREALAESLTQVGIKISDLSTVDRVEIIDVTMPVIRAQLMGEVRKDRGFRDALRSFFGSAEEWGELLDNADDFLSEKKQEFDGHRTHRQQRGWRRFIWSRRS